MFEKNIITESLLRRRTIMARLSDVKGYIVVPHPVTATLAALLLLTGVKSEGAPMIPSFNL